jgi:hypothetical protein
LADPSLGVGVADPMSDRAAVWLPLLRELTETSPDRIVFKRSAAAFRGVSDIDAYAPPGSWPEIERRFQMWAGRTGLQVVVVCRHDWRGPTLVAVRPGDPHLFTLDVKSTRFLHGSPLFKPSDLVRVSTVDDDGIRHLRVGADGAIKLLIDGMTRSGKRNDAGLAAKGIIAALAADPDAAMAASLFAGMAAPAMRRGMEALLAGGWSRLDMGLVSAWFHARALARPDLLMRLLHWRFVAAPSCAVGRSVVDNAPVDGDAWLRAVRDSHRIESETSANVGAVPLE